MNEVVNGVNRKKIKKATQICDEGVQTDSRPDGETKKRVSKAKPISFTQRIS